MMSDCTHEDFAASVDVQRIADGEGQIRNFLADVTVRCAGCGTPFHFVGVDCGLSFKHPTGSVGSTTLHAPIAPGEGPLPGRIRFEVV
jgi:hypothetical protein